MDSWIRAIARAAVLPALAVSQTSSADVTRSDADDLQIERLATLEFPWGMAYLPDGRLLITARPKNDSISAAGFAT